MKLVRECEEHKYMVMDRCRGDFEFYINTLSGHCGNCTEKNLFFGDIKSHIGGGLKTIQVPSC